MEPTTSINLSTTEPVVLHDRSAIQSPAALKLLLSAIFKTSQLPEVLNDFFAVVIQHLSTHAWTHEQIVQELGRFLVQVVQANPNYSKAHELLHAIAVHKMVTFKSRTAYAPQTKQNPNAVFWPDPTHPKYPRSPYDELPFTATTPWIDQSTPIVSLGSCFAMEIAKRLKSGRFNYLVTEPNEICSARWGIVFNTPTFRQIVEKSFGLIQLPRILWENVVNGQVQYWDPFREDVFFESIAAYEADYGQHIAASRRAFVEADVLILTMGMNEIWRLKSDGSVLSRCPWGIASFLVEPQVMSVEENVAELQRALDIIRAHNPKIKIILSVSPVPLHGTFRGDQYHVVAANSHSKSVLRVAAQKFAEQNSSVYYFPSYEVVSYCTEFPWDTDLRHVSSSAVDNVMRLFDHMFVQPGINASTSPKQVNMVSDHSTLASSHATSSAPSTPIVF